MLGRSPYKRESWKQLTKVPPPKWATHQIQIAGMMEMPLLIILQKLFAQLNCKVQGDKVWSNQFDTVAQRKSSTLNYSPMEAPQAQKKLVLLSKRTEWRLSGQKTRKMSTPPPKNDLCLVLTHFNTELPLNWQCCLCLSSTFHDPQWQHLETALLRNLLDTQLLLRGCFYMMCFIH